MQEAIKAPGWARHYYGKEVPTEFNFELHSVQKFLDKAAENYPKRSAILFQNLKMNYKQLQEKAENMAASLRKHGLKTGDRVGVMMPNIPQTIVSIWGILKAGGVVVMTNPLYMEKELTHHFNDSRTKFLLLLDLFWDKVDALQDKLGIEKCFVSTLSDGLAFPLNMLYPLQAKRTGTAVKVKYNNKNVFTYKSLLATRARYTEEPEDPAKTIAFLQYTGGTTGFSKAAMLTHGNICAHMQQLDIVHKAKADVEQLSVAVMPFFHIFGLAGTVIMPAHLASPTLPVPRYVPRDILELIKKYRPSLFIGAPSVYMGLMEQKNIKDYDLTCIELCIVGAAPFPVDAFNRFRNITQANITEGLGLTECSPCVTANPVFGEKKPGSCGVAFPGTEIKIMDMETGTREVGVHEIGEMVIKGPQVMIGYWEKEEETAEALRDGWFYTGDVAYKDEDGYYFIVDRKKHMAIIGGYNVYPREIDEVLYEHPKIKEAVSLAVPHRSRGEVLKAYIVPKDGETVTIPELVAFCKEKLANYKVPRFFEFRQELPKSKVGKILGRVLRDEEIEKQDADKDKKVENAVQAEQVEQNQTASETANKE